MASQLYEPYSIAGQTVLITGAPTIRGMSDETLSDTPALLPGGAHPSTPAALRPAGASAGIGEACAWRFAELGCKLVLIARRAVRLAALSEALAARFPGLQCHTICLDVRELEAIQELPSQLPAAFGEVDILLNK